MSDEDAIQPVNSAENINGPPETPTFYLTPEQIATGFSFAILKLLDSLKGLSVLARTGNGLSHAYTKLELHNTGATTIDAVEYYPHIRYIVSSISKLVWFQWGCRISPTILFAALSLSANWNFSCR